MSPVYQCTMRCHWCQCEWCISLQCRVTGVAGVSVYNLVILVSVRMVYTGVAGVHCSVTGVIGAKGRQGASEVSHVNERNL